MRKLWYGMALVSALVAPMIPVERSHATARRATMMAATQVMNWFPEPEHGGQYAGIQFGLYRQRGLDLKIKQFNPQVNCETLAATGRVDFCMDNADSVLEARQQGIPIVAVMTDFQVSPQGILWHAEDTSMHGVADLSNHTFVYSFGAGYWDFLRNKYHYTNVKTQNFDFTLRAFYANPKAVNQIYVTSEPYTAQTQGHNVKWGLIADSGYDPYAQVFVTSERMVREHPDVVCAFVQGSIAGWKVYFKQPEKVFSYIGTVPGAKSYPLSLGAMRFSFKELKPLVLGKDSMHGVGYIDPARMTLLKRQMTSVGIKLDKVDVSKAFTDQFVQ